MVTDKDRKEEWVPQNRETEGTWGKQQSKEEEKERKPITAKKGGKFI